MRGSPNFTLTQNNQTEMRETDALEQISNKTLTLIQSQDQSPYGILCFLYINPKINNDSLNDIIEMLTVYSMKENFVSLIGDLNIQSEFGIDTLRKLMDIFQKLVVKSAV